MLTFIFLKKSNSLNKFNITTSENIIKNIFKKDLRKEKIMNLMYVFMILFINIQIKLKNNGKIKNRSQEKRY